jgi:hypothetical protein
MSRVLAIGFKRSSPSRSTSNREHLLDLAALILVLVLFLASEIALINFDGTAQRSVEGARAHGVPQAMQHEPRRLLRNLQIARERRARDALTVRRSASPITPNPRIMPGA